VHSVQLAAGLLISSDERNLPKAEQAMPQALQLVTQKFIL